jgi:hypothetical protein
MKKNLLIIVMLLVTAGLMGQTATQQAAVIQKIIDLPELQQYYPKNADGNLKQLCITQYLISFPEDLPVAKAGSKILFLAPQEIIANKIEAYFTFRSFGMDQNAANTSFSFFYQYDYTTEQFKMLSVNLELKKTGTDWIVSSLNIGGDK